MTEQTQSDDVKIPAQSAAPAAEALPDAGPVTAPSGEDVAEPAPAKGGTEAPVEPAPAESAPAESAVGESAPEEAVSDGEATEAVVESVLAGAASAGAVADAAPEAVPAESVLAEAASPRPRKRLRDRRGLRAALRWTAAVVVFAALGGAAAYAVTQPERTEIPGLETPDDGRWAYPALKLPKLPAGAPRALDTERNRPRRHYADVRTLLLPVPAGAKVDKGFPGATGWLPTGDFLELYPKGDRKELGATLEQNTLRHIAARAWTMADGTRAEVYLLQFATLGHSSDVKDKFVVDGTPAKAESADYDTEWESTWLDDPELHVSLFDEDKPRGAEHVRFGYVQAGDVLALVVLSKAGTQPAVPFHQTVLLQAQLLG
ncbi:hypothetical protein [Actinacidiphila sp. bgisy160]|uniref:hypothetical protein n=1 Tax=Actinacidiphila sp. bgisy160 TaxID=3413796 RepID=UPI003D7359FE